MLLLCSYNSYNTCNVTFVKKNRRNNVLKKIAPPPPLFLPHYYLHILGSFMFNEEMLTIFGSDTRHTL